jgi:hypothetical protein
MLVGVAWLCVAFGLYAASIAFPNDALAMLVAASVVASLLGTVVAHFRLGRICNEFFVAVGLSGLVGAAFSFFVIQFEWHGEPLPNGEHPWPNGNELYVITALLRCGMLGALIGYPVARTLDWAQGNCRCNKRRKGTRWLVAGLVVLTVVSWFPVTNWHFREWSIRRLLASIEQGRIDDISSRIAVVARFHGEQRAVGLVAGRALRGRNEQVRLCAIESFRLLRQPAIDARIFDQVLKELLQDQSDNIRKAAGKVERAGP